MSKRVVCDSSLCAFLRRRMSRRTKIEEALHCDCWLKQGNRGASIGIDGMDGIVMMISIMMMGLGGGRTLTIALMAKV